MTTKTSGSSSTPPQQSNNFIKDVVVWGKTMTFPTQPLPRSSLEKELSPKEHPKLPDVTANLLQTAQGPRIVVEGIKRSNIPKEDWTTIEQQAVEQLLRAQAEARQQKKVPPTKIIIDLPQSIQGKLKTTKNSEVSVMTMEQPLPQSINYVPPTQPPIILPTLPVANPVVKEHQVPRILLKNAPPTAENAMPHEVTAHVLGPRIVQIAGIKRSKFPEEDWSTIKQQVRDQLGRAQAEARQQNKVPPTKIVIDLPQSIKAKLKMIDESEVSFLIIGHPLPQSLNTPLTFPPASLPILLPTVPVAKSMVMEEQGGVALKNAPPTSEHAKPPEVTAHFIQSAHGPRQSPTMPVANPLIKEQQEPGIALKNAPPTSEHPKSSMVTARFLQSDEGLRIVVHGLQGSNLPKEDIARIQQQAKTKLSRVLTKAEIVIALPASIRAKLEGTQPAAFASAAAEHDNNSRAGEQGMVAMVKPIINTHQAENIEIMYV